MGDVPSETINVDSLRTLIYTVTVKKSEKRDVLTAVRPRVKALLTRSPAFRSLPPDVRRQITHDTTEVANYLALPDAKGRVANVDFPDFVVRLIEGVFDAIVYSSIEQMEAYAKLVAGVAKSLDEFSNSNLSDKQARDYLLAQFPDFFKGRGTKNRPPVRLATSRQQLLATMMLMGINRIVVTDRRIRQSRVNRGRSKTR